MTATLADVARKAGVSTAAASNALRKTARAAGVRESTRTRILAAARDLGYQPNPFAASLRSRRTRTLGLFLPEDPRAFFFHPYNAERFASMMGHISRLGYRMTLFCHDWATPPDARLMDGCLFLGWIPDARIPDVEQLATRIPVLCAYQRIRHAIELHQDEKAARGTGARLAAGYLYDRGHRHIAIVDVQHRGAIDAFRLAAFKAVAQERALAPRLHLFGDRWETRRYASIPRILDLAPQPTAVMALDDDHARVLIDSLAQCGCRVPQHLSVFSGDTALDGFQSVPPLSGIGYDREAGQRILVERFLDIVEERTPAVPITLPPLRAELIERASCRAIKVAS